MVTTNTQATDTAIEARYQQAQTLLQGLLSNRLVLNDALFPHWIDGSQSFWYPRETSAGNTFIRVDASTGEQKEAFDHQALADALAKASGQAVDLQKLPIVVQSLTLSPLVVHFSAWQKNWCYEAHNQQCYESPTEPVIAGLPSPDAGATVMVRDHNLWLRNHRDNSETALTTDGCSDSPYATAASLLNAVDSNDIQALWSSDSRYLLTHQLQCQQVESLPIVDHCPNSDSLRPQCHNQRAAFAGDASKESYQLLVIDTRTAAVQRLDYPPLPLNRMDAGFFTRDKLSWWSQDNQEVYFIDLARGAKSLRLVAWSIASGHTRTVLEEHSDSFIKLSHGMLEAPLFRPLPETDELIWFSEREGAGQLYLYDLRTGALKQTITGAVAPTGWVRSVLFVDSARRELLIQTAGRDPQSNPYYRDICRVCIDTGKLTPLVEGPLDYVVYQPDNIAAVIRSALGIDNADINGVSPCGDYLVATGSRVDTAPVSLLIDRQGNTTLLETADTSGLPANWQWPEAISVTAADGQTPLYGVMYLPPDYNPEQRYPVLDFASGHPGFSYVPHGAFTNDPFAGEPYLLGAAYATLGFIVVALDVPGTPYRDRAFQASSYGCMVSANRFEDRIAGLRQLARQHPAMDLDRVGLIGCDGITGPVYGLLQHPDFYQVGVMAALADARFESAATVEMFEGPDPEHKTPYAEEWVTALQGRLLLMHGMKDIPTPAVGSFRLIEALQRANKDVDILLLPNDGHEISTYAHRRSWDYLVTHLQQLKPPREFPLVTGWDLLFG